MIPTSSSTWASLRVRGRLGTITEPALEAHVRDLLARKYWMAWIGSWFGKGPERTFRVDQLTLGG